MKKITAQTTQDFTEHYDAIEERAFELLRP